VLAREPLALELTPAARASAAMALMASSVLIGGLIGEGG
jgi:hypothetical protein